MKNYAAIAIINYFNDTDEKTDKEIIVLTEVESYKDAMARIEDYYGLDLESLQITLIDGPFLKIDSQMLDKIMMEDIADA